MRAGDLRHRVTIQAPAEGRDSMGAVTSTWGDVATVWAAVEPLSGREYLAAGQMQHQVTTRIRMRYRDGITTKMRVKHGESYYDIQGVINIDGRNRELHLMCVERSEGDA